MGRIIQINNRLILMRAIEDKESNPRLKRAIHSSYVRERQILLQEKECLIKEELLLPEMTKCESSLWDFIKRFLRIIRSRFANQE